MTWAVRMINGWSWLRIVTGLGVVGVGYILSDSVRNLN